MTPGLGTTAALLLATAAGLPVVGLAFGRAAATTQEWLGRLALAAVVGQGLLTLFTIAWLFLAGGLGRAYPFADTAACLLLTGALLRSPRARDGLGLGPPRAVELAVTGLLLVAVALATWRFVAATQAMPHGEWDAWEVWNYRARPLFRGGDGWRAAFATGIKSTEYPLLLPLAIARLWTYGGESTLAPSVVAGLFTLGGPLIVAGLVTGISGGVAGATSGLLLLGTSGYQWWGAQQYADVPLATLLAAAGGILLLARRGPDAGSRPLLALGGLLLGLAGWTKTDGVVAAGLVVAVLLASEAWRGGGAAARAVIAPVAVGAMLPALAWGVQHVVLAPALAPVLTVGQSNLEAKLLDPARWSTVLAWFLDKAPGRDIWLPVLMVGIALLERLQPRRLVRSPALWCAVLLYLVDVLVFVSTPLDLKFHLITAGDRLLLQPWPLLVLAVFASVAAGGPAADDGPAPPAPETLTTGPGSATRRWRRGRRPPRRRR
jgi:hypothetical protein